MPADWKTKLTFLTPNSVSHKIGDKEYNFYPISVGLAFKLRAVAKPLTRALTALLGGSSNDTGSIQRKVANDKGGDDQEIVVEPISADLAKLRHEQRQTAVSELVDVLTAEANINIIGDIMVDSLRDIFPPGDKTNPSGADFMAQINLPDLPELLWGIAKANKGVFGPLVGKIEGLMSSVKSQIEKRVLASHPDLRLTPDQTEANGESPNDGTKETQTKAG